MMKYAQAAFNPRCRQISQVPTKTPNDAADVFLLRLCTTNAIAAHLWATCLGFVTNAAPQQETDHIHGSMLWRESLGSTSSPLLCGLSPAPVTTAYPPCVTTGCMAAARCHFRNLAFFAIVAFTAPGYMNVSACLPCTALRRGVAAGARHACVLELEVCRVFASSRKLSRLSL